MKFQQEEAQNFRSCAPSTATGRTAESGAARAGRRQDLLGVRGERTAPVPPFLEGSNSEGYVTPS